MRMCIICFIPWCGHQHKKTLDLATNYRANKHPMIDMKTPLDEEGNIVYQHYEKSMASKQVISERSAHASDIAGLTPLNRPREFEKAKRRKDKIKRKQKWTAGGFLAPIIVQAMPGEVLEGAGSVTRLE